MHHEGEGDVVIEVDGDVHRPGSEGPDLDGEVIDVLCEILTRYPQVDAFSFDGLHYTENCGGVQCGDGHPPDTNGDVGPRYYVETVNTAVGIYDKSTGTRVVHLRYRRGSYPAGA